MLLIKKNDLKITKSIYLSIFTCLLFNIITIFSVYKILNYNLAQQYISKQQTYTETLRYLLSRSLGGRSDGSLGQDLLFFQKTINSLPKNLHLEPQQKIIMENGVLYAVRDEEIVMIYLQPLKDVVRELLPSYMIYSIEVDNIEIASNKEQGSILEIEQTYNLDQGSKLFIAIGMNPNSIEYLDNKMNLYKNLFKVFCGLLLFSSIILSIILRQKKNIVSLIGGMQEEINDLNQENEALLQHISIDDKLKLFLANA